MNYSKAIRVARALADVPQHELAKANFGGLKSRLDA